MLCLGMDRFILLEIEATCLVSAGYRAVQKEAQGNKQYTENDQNYCWAA